MSDSTKQIPLNDDVNSTSVNSVKMSMKHRKIGEFSARESLLADLFQIPHINCIRNVFAAGFIIMILRQTINDLIHYRRLNWTFELLFLTVGKLHIVVIIWFLMSLCTSVVIFYSTYSWAKNRRFTGNYLKLYDTTWLGIYICYIVGFLLIPSQQIIKHQLPIVSSTIIVAEQVRQLMKIHSFVRENIGKIVQSSFDQQLSIEFSHFNQYLYFLFAPTLLYRNNYPRTPLIRWNIVFNMFGQFLIICFLIYHLVANFWMPTFTNFFINDHITLELTISIIFDLMFPGVLILILSFYGFFHCWLNGFAELLRFADRMFYKDWWNSTSAPTFWRSWNIVVHDWLYVYVYKDLTKLFNGNRNLSTTGVVILSAIFHEYVVTIALGVFSPVLIIWFALFGMLLRFTFPSTQGTQWNIVLLTFIPITTGLIPYFYALEISAWYFPSKRKTFWNWMFSSDKQSKYEL